MVIISVYAYTNEEVIEKFSNTVYQIALCRIKNINTAEDIFQDVFLQLVKSKKTFKDENHLKAWLIRVTINKSNNFLKSGWNNKIVPLDEAFDESIFIKTDDLDDILEKLPDRLKLIIHLFYYEDMPIKQIADLLSVKPSTVTSGLTKARKLLKTYLEGDYTYD